MSINVLNNCWQRAYLTRVPMHGQIDIGNSLFDVYSLMTCPNRIDFDWVLLCVGRMPDSRAMFTFSIRENHWCSLCVCVYAPVMAMTDGFKSAHGCLWAASLRSALRVPQQSIRGCNWIVRWINMHIKLFLRHAIDKIMSYHNMRAGHNKWHEWTDLLLWEQNISLWFAVDQIGSDNIDVYFCADEISRWLCASVSLLNGRRRTS